MDKYLYNKLRRLHRPGRGKQMKAEILQEFLVKALTERPKDLEVFVITKKILVHQIFN